MSSCLSRSVRKGSPPLPESAVKLRLESTCSLMAWRASSGIRMRMADTTEIWLYFTLGIHGLPSLPLSVMNCSMDA